MIGSADPSSHHFSGTDIILLVVVVILIFATGYLAMSETAITRTSKVKALTLVEENRRGANTLLRLVERIDRVLPVVLFALEVCTLVAATLVGVVAAHAFGGLGVILAIVFEIVVIFIFAELAPKTWAVQHPDRSALTTAPIIRLLLAFKPLVWLTQALIAITNAILPGKGSRGGPYTSDEMLRAIADEAAEEDVIEHEERTLIHSIIDFGDTVVREVMVPRPDMVAVESYAHINDVIDIVIASGFSRIPVYSQGIDDIVGIVFLKDMMREEREGHRDREVSTVMREARFTPESKRVSELMREMQAGQVPHGHRRRRVRRHRRPGHPRGPDRGAGGRDHRRVRRGGNAARETRRRHPRGQRQDARRRGQRTALRQQPARRRGLGHRRGPAL